MRLLLASVLVLLPPAVLALGLAGSGNERSSSRWIDSNGTAGSALLIAELNDTGHGDDDDDDDDFAGIAEFFVENPLINSSNIVVGDALDRLTWQSDDPAFPGDAPGSLSALYDSSMPAGLFGLPLPESLGQDDAFTAAVVWVIESDGFVAEPDGFFQISWGFWNRTETGLNRTGNLDSFASDAFELIEFNWFPNASPIFGGPFLGPNVFGEATGDDPDAFFNGSFLFGLELALPLDTPLVTVMQHRPGDDALVVQIFTIDSDGRVLPLNGGVGVVQLGFLSSRQYRVDAIGPTLWTDGFGGPDPAVRANVVYHAIVVQPGVIADPSLLLP